MPQASHAIAHPFCEKEEEFYGEFRKRRVESCKLSVVVN